MQLTEAITTGKRCTACNGEGRVTGAREYWNGASSACDICGGTGLETVPEYGAVADGPVSFPPGSIEKVRTLCLRYQTGLPLWHDDDCRSYGEDLS